MRHKSFSSGFYFKEKCVIQLLFPKPEAPSFKWLSDITTTGSKLMTEGLENPEETSTAKTQRYQSWRK